MRALLTIWLPVAVTVAAAAVLYGRRPAASMRRALRALERVVQGEAEPAPHLRLVVDNTRVDRAA